MLYGKAKSRFSRLLDNSDEVYVCILVRVGVRARFRVWSGCTVLKYSEKSLGTPFSFILFYYVLADCHRKPVERREMAVIKEWTE